ncbi:TRAP-type C4-dicarboxylate transport system, large permease component [Halomonas citrativorans]|uniref:TRAP transporter large permease protein n=1 Tax=Halomonas citrativorans TaxID=2742612 RepID=A0A1R4HV38_9GAMM|nr:TRAP transporter large permease [Halomonas citrativorans]SJN11430.1 TRAP-type C4-dicarboxylate transport system, large permease component [Halomonas citrativorans]
MTLIMLIGFAILMVIGLPIGYALILSATIALVGVGDMPGTVILLKVFQPLQNSVLIAIPFFILSGALMMNGSLGKQLIGFATRLVGRFRGGLGQVNVAGSALFGGVSGSAVADASAIGGMLIPWMTREGYPPSLSAAITASSSIISVLIPPSIPLILYATVSNQSVADLFMAGIIPGVLLVVGLSMVCWLMGYLRDLPLFSNSPDAPSIGRALLTAAPAISLPLLIVVLLRMGIATPTEVSVLAVGYALMLRTVIYRDLTMKSLVVNLLATLVTTGVVMIVISASNLVGYVLAFENIPNRASEWALTVFSDPWQIILMMNLAMLVVGMFIDLSAAILLLAPLFVAMANAIGLNLTQLGVMMTINLAIGLFTPPVGTTLFISSAIAKVNVGAVAREMWPFYLVAAAVLLLVAFFPPITTF